MKLDRFKMINILVVCISVIIMCLSLIIGICHTQKQCELKYESELEQPTDLESIENCLDFYAKQYGYYVSEKSDNTYECHFIYKHPIPGRGLGYGKHVKYTYKINDVIYRYKLYLAETSQYAIVEYNLKEDLTEGAIISDITIMKMY